MQRSVGSVVVLVLTAFATAVLGCNDEPEDSNTDGRRWAPCDPWDQPAAPIELADVLGAGRADDHRLYVIDREPERGPRLFVSEGGELVRLPVRGTGSESTGGVERLFVSSTVDSRPVRVLLERSAGSRRMLLLEGDDAAGRDFDLDNPRGKPLAIVDDSEYGSLEVRNLPAFSKVEYAAQVEPDEYLVVLGPEDLESFDDYVLFFGTEDRVRQRDVLTFQRARDGGTTTIEFDLDGDLAQAHFPNRIQPGGDPITEPVTFEVDGASRAITKLPSDRASIDDLSFECRR